MHKDINTGRQTDRRTGGKTDKKADRKSDGKTDRPIMHLFLAIPTFLIEQEQPPVHYPRPQVSLGTVLFH